MVKISIQVFSDLIQYNHYASCLYIHGVSSVIPALPYENIISGTNSVITTSICVTSLVFPLLLRSERCGFSQEWYPCRDCTQGVCLGQRNWGTFNNQAVDGEDLCFLSLNLLLCVTFDGNERRQRAVQCTKLRSRRRMLLRKSCTSLKAVKLHCR